MKTVKAIWTRKYGLTLQKKREMYVVAVSRTKDKEPTMFFDTPDYVYAMELFDSVLENLNTL